MIAVVFVLPSHSNHIWYHMFCPGELENTHLTGFMYPNKVKKGGLMYDCGCEVNEDGQYGRKDYIPHATRGTLSLHSWYLMLWTNFGTFCVGLLTQPEALDQIKGRILSDWMSIRGYCITQLRTVWLQMRTNMGFGDDERSFFIMRSMHTLFMLCQDGRYPFSQGKFTDMKSLDAYEKAWHTCIYEPSKANLQAKANNYFSDSVWVLPVLKNYRTLNEHYPHLATENEYMKSLVAAREAHDLDDAHLFALHLFTLEYERLQLGGALLPDLVEFYQWIHTHLSYLVTYEKAQQITIGKIISLSAKRYSQELCEHLTDLFKRIIEKYNAYLKVNGGTIGEASCDRTAKPTDAKCIDENTPLIALISHKNEENIANDWLHIVLMHIIGCHNSFLNSIFDHAKDTNCHYQKYLPNSPPELHPTEVTSQSCIVPSDRRGTGKKQFLKLIRSCSMYNGVQSSSMFDLEQLQQNVVAFYIAGKPLITSNDIKIIFRFRDSPNEITLGNNPGCAIDISSVAQELPRNFKEPLQEETKKSLEYHFRTATYQTLTEIVTGLRTILGHLIQDILQQKSKVWDTRLNITIASYLKASFNKDQETVFGEIGIQSISDKQKVIFGEIEMKRLFRCMGLFVGWLQGGLYDFSTLPVSVFKHLDNEDKETLQKIPDKYSLGEKDLLTDFDEFEKIMNHAESHLTTQAELRKSVKESLLELGLCEPTEKLITLIPKSILAYHYVQFRMTLRKINLKVMMMVNLRSQNPSTETVQWTEIIEDLWKYLPHFQDEEQLYDENCLKFDCIKLQFGDGEESESGDEPWPHDNSPYVDEEANDSHIPSHSTINNNETAEPSPAPVSTPATSVLLSAKPSGKAENMTTKELCEWLKTINVSDDYIKLFEENDINGGILTTFADEDLKDMGISKGFIRKKIMVQLRQIQ
ncbi:uncharacterized protein [Dysidea avara]|uniref:uncharacterized protein isoform X2 n=1 Tax=Dysidea avara TaxID=196820 RepID=UPI00331DB8A7